MKKKRLDIISIVISFIAVLIAYLGYRNSRDALELEKDRLIREKSPGLVLNNDSGNINFEVDKENARLQTIILKFPDSIKVSPLLAYGIEKKFNIKVIEEVVLAYFDKRILKKDSFAIVGELRIPIVVDYEVVIDRESKLFREDHFLVFIISSESDKVSIVFDHSVFNFKLGIPLQSHNFFKVPFTEFPEEKIRKTDIQDLKEYLDGRFSQAVDYYRFKGLLK